MKNPLNIKNVFSYMEKAKKYVQLLNNGVSKMEAVYQIFGTETGDEMVRLWQHEIILDQPNLN